MASFVTVNTCCEPAEALVLSSFLDAYGVVHIVPDRYLTSNSWHFLPAWKFVRLSVLDTSLKDMHELLKSVPTENSAEGSEPKKLGLVHPHIGGFEMLIFILVFLWCFVPMPLWRRRWRRG